MIAVALLLAALVISGGLSSSESELDSSTVYSGDQQVLYRQAMDNCLELPVPVGPQGGGVYQAAIQAIDQHDIDGDVVMVFGDTILKNVSRF